jgi:uncharacterized membrane protein
MFDLEKSIAEWRKQMLAAGIKFPIPLEELEIHLREEIEQQMKSGLSGAEAFDSAVQKIGHAYNLQNEFKKVNGTVRAPAIVFALFLIGSIIFISCTISLLPQRMATHFDASGQPNGWMSRSSAVIFQGIIGLVLPLIITSVFCTIRFVPTRLINVPQRDFWFAPERREETCAYLSRQGLWLASLLLGLQCMVWYQLIESNSKNIPHLSSSGFLSTLGVFGVAMIVWVMKLFRHFGKTT